MIHSNDPPLIQSLMRKLDEVTINFIEVLNSLMRDTSAKKSMVKVVLQLI